MTSDQQSPGTSGRPSPGLDGLLPPGPVVTVTGPWTVRSCVTAACTNCGAVPLDEDTSTTPHFDDTAQAAQELVRNLGWHHKRGTWPKDDELLCPACAAPPGARPARKGNGPKAPRLSPRDLEWARTRVKAVTGWIATREGGSQPGPAAVEAAVRILATPPHRRDTSSSAHAATVYRVNGHLVAIYRYSGRSEVVTAECSCPDAESVCEHLLVALAYEDHL